MASVPEAPATCATTSGAMPSAAASLLPSESGAATCEGPRSTDDYIEIAREFGIVLLGGVPTFDAGNEDAARRFVNLVDEFYDRQVTLVCTAAAAPVALYRGSRLAGAFERTASRLIEMQSAEYLARTHRG